MFANMNGPFHTLIGSSLVQLTSLRNNGIAKHDQKHMSVNSATPRRSTATLRRRPSLQRSFATPRCTRGLSKPPLGHAAAWDPYAMA